MRLTIFHTCKVEPMWKNSLNKLIAPLSYKDLAKLGDVHIAVFNDGVVGISVSKNNNIVYLKVRDITRRRGVGKYLIEETCNFVLDNYDSSTVKFDIADVTTNEQDGLIYFLEMQGFIKDSTNPNLYVYTDDTRDDNN